MTHKNTASVGSVHVGGSVSACFVPNPGATEHEMRISSGGVRQTQRALAVLNCGEI